jgi:hypothetical protein
MKRRIEIKNGLPHLFSFKFYTWMRNFWSCEKQFQYIFLPNQVGKSSIMIRRIIHYCTEPKSWTRFKRQPRMVMYFYPDKKTILREISTKWPEFLPQGIYKDDDKYGYTIKYQGGYPDRIEWKSGVTLFFMTYGTSNIKESAQRMQASTPSIVAADEVVPEQLINEIIARVSSPANIGAMFWQACTPTRFEPYLQKIQNGKTKMPDSYVQTNSLFDCVEYEDGSKSPWTVKEIEKKISTYTTQRDVQIRVYGKFSASEGLQFPQFHRDRHFQPRHHVPKDWDLYAGIDYGSGGATGHPSSVAIIAVNSEYSKARVMSLSRMDKDRFPNGTTEDDVLNEYLLMCQDLGRPFATAAYYDWACGAMAVSAAQRGISLINANKKREDGKNIINSLFKNDMMLIYQDAKPPEIEGADTEAEKLCDELEALMEGADKKSAKDDLIDALRYAVSSLTWNFVNVVVKDPNDNTPTKPKPKTIKRRGVKIHSFDDFEDEMEREIHEQNELYEC